MLEYRINHESKLNVSARHNPLENMPYCDFTMFFLDFRVDQLTME